MIPESKNEIQLTHAGHFLNGACSMTLAIGITQPATTIKTFSQSNIVFFSSKKGMSVRHLIKGLWAGFLPNAASGAGAESIAFLVYNIGRKSLQNELGELSTTRNLALSSISGILGSPANSVLEQLMIRQQLYRGNLISHLKAIYQADGLIKGVFKGSCVTGGRDMGFNLGVFAFNDITKEMLKPVIEDPLTLEFSSGLLAGGIAGLLSNPWDRSKTMMQGDLTGKYTTFRSTLKIIYLEEGWKGWFRGGVARTISISLLVCFTAMLKQRIPQFAPEPLKAKGIE